MNHYLSSVHPSSTQTQLFTVRLWHERVGNNRVEIRGKVQHVISGEVEYFRDWRALEAFMTAQMAEVAAGSAE